MSDQETENDRSLIQYWPHGRQRRIASWAMVEGSLALAKESTVSRVDLDALVREGKRLQRKEGMIPDDVRAFDLFHQAATAEHHEAQFLAFQCYRDGNGVPQDLISGIEWLKKSAESGFAPAQCTIAY
jgi:TPR repeat protein